MTDRKQALQDLLVKVQAGWPEHVDQAYMPPFLAAFDMSWVAMYAWKANQGSLDAAMALHDAVLPGWGWYLDDCGSVSVYFGENGLEFGARNTGNPARAWICAILQALIAECDA